MPCTKNKLIKNISILTLKEISILTFTRTADKFIYIVPITIESLKSSLKTLENLSFS